MTEKQDQRICIKFCFQLGKTSSETIQMMQKAFGNECMSKTRIKEWYNRFKGGRTSVDSESRSGRPSTTKTLDNIERVRLAIEQDRRMTVRELEEELGIPKTIIWEILTSNLQMTRVCAKFIPKLLRAEQKKLRLEIAQDNLEMVNNDDTVLKKVITGDESWVYGYELNNNLHNLREEKLINKLLGKFYIHSSKCSFKFYFSTIPIYSTLSKIVQGQSLVKEIKFLDLKENRRMHNHGLGNSVPMLTHI
ncbi:PREDICTED: putative uncharacterized protein FLJ37770 [Trachymyrmex cornetzi]|uniref:putative uncharacterized protein FLJ37770 n=1 Tax=Trachymyrmex cornetzi TaxID=471704 RepID=UPI00084F01E8|nr:PREDICTED: putative uncharacterized protein FLJ37770 [Trachymyrmex cornetzi]